jgi:hypothetical protein
MEDELNYDSLLLSQPLKPSQTSIPKPKVFSLTQSVNQQENLVMKSTGSRDRPSFSENPKAFRPARLFGGPSDQSAKRAPIFPALQRFQQSQNQQQPPKSQSTTPFLSFLKPPTPAPTSTPTDVFRSQAHPLDSSPSHDPEPSCKSFFSSSYANVIRCYLSTSSRQRFATFSVSAVEYDAYNTASNASASFSCGPHIEARFEGEITITLSVVFERRERHKRGRYTRLINSLKVKRAAGHCNDCAT